MALKSDSQGFLIGSGVEPSSLTAELRGVRREVQALRHDAKARAQSRRNASARAAAAAPAKRRRPQREGIATLAADEDSIVAGPSFGRGSRLVGRVASATSEAAKGVVNEEADASVKALKEVAEPLKRGWNALRGGGDGAERATRRNEGWLRRIFGALRRDGSGKIAGADGDSAAPSRFESAREAFAARTSGARVRGGAAPSGSAIAVGASATGSHELSLRSIEGYLKSIDGKVRKPERENLMLRLLVGVVRAIVPVVAWLRERRMDSNLNKIERWTKAQYEASEPFFTYVRRRLREMGELEGAPEEGRGWLGTIIATTLGALFAKLARALSRVPLLGRAVASLARLLGGSVPLAAGMRGRGGRAVLAGPARRAPVWGRTAEGVRGSRAVRLARVGMRGAGRALAPVAAVAKRIPVLGSLLAIGAGVLGSRAIAADRSLTKEQKHAAHGKTWGGVGLGLGGAAAGAALGTAILPGIGTVVGGVLGAVLGDWLGGNLGEAIGARFSGWIETLTPYWAGMVAVGHMMFDGLKSAWEAVATPAGELLASVGSNIKESWGKLTELATTGFRKFFDAIAAIYNGLRDMPVVGRAIRAAEEAARRAADLARRGGAAAREAAQSVAKKVAESAPVRAVADAGKWVLGKVSAAFESGRSGAGTVSTGRGDHGGVSYGTHQLSSKAGTLQKFLAQSGYASQFAGLTPGSAEFSAKWREIARNDKGFGEAQHNFIKATHYDPQMARLAKNGIDLSGRGRAVQEAVFSTSVQFGGQSSLIQKALRGRDVSKMSDADIVNAIQDYKAANNDALFKSSSADVRAGTLARVERERSALLSLPADAAPRPGAAAPGPGAAAAKVTAAPGPGAAVAKVAAPVVAAATPPVPPRAPVAAPIADAPTVQTPLGSGRTDRPVAVQMQQPDVGQDVRDRGIAHIATGGYARA